MRSRSWKVLTVSLATGIGLVAGGAIGLLAQGQPGGRSRSSPVSQPSSPSPTPRPAVRPVVPDTILAWTPGGLPPSLAAGVRKLPAVDHVVDVVSGIVWLTGSYDGTGNQVDRPPAGLGIPLEVAGADLAQYAHFLSPADRSALPLLARGEVALGASSAALRRLGPGGTLVFGHRQVRIGAVLPDASIGANEVFASRATAARLGVAIPRYLLIDPARNASRRKLTAGIRSLLPPGVLLQIRGPGETPFFRQGDAVLPTIRMKELFGEFAARPEANGFFEMDPNWVTRHIVTASVPLLGSVRCNRALFPQLQGALTEVVSQGLSQLLRPGDYGGCYSPRFINANPRAGISHHAWGAAIDINVSTNQYGHTPHQDPRLVAIFERWGFTWGGRWLLPDGMHFEFIRFPSGG